MQERVGRTMLKKAATLLCITLVLTIFSCHENAIADDGFRTDNIYLAGNVGSILKNVDGENLIVTRKNPLSGTMEILKLDYTESVPSQYILTVRESPYYDYEQTETGKGYCSIMDASDNYISLATTNRCKALIEFSPVARVALSGSTQRISINATMTPGSPDYTIDGKLSKPMSIEYKKTIWL